MTTTQTLGKVVGANVRRLRQAQDSTLEDLARAVRGLGIDWSVSRVVAIERGTREPKLASLLVLAKALNCGMADLLETDARYIELGTVAVYAQHLREMFAGPTPTPRVDEMSDDDWAATRGYGSSRHMMQTLGMPADSLRSWASRSGLVEERTCRMLDLDPDVLTVLSSAIWGSTLGEVRNRRAEEEGRPPSDVTAELRNQIREEIADWTREQRRPTDYYNPETDDPKPID